MANHERDLVIEVKSVDNQGRITKAWVVNGCWTLVVDWDKDTAQAFEGPRIVREFPAADIAQSLEEALVVNSSEFEQMKRNCPVRRPKWRVS